MSLAGLSPLVAPILNRDTALADAGFYFTALTVPGTGIASTITIETTLAQAEVSPYMVVYNGSSGSNAVNIYPLYLRLTMTAANAGGASHIMRFTMELDQGNPVTTPATAQLTPVNVNIGSPNKSQAQINLGTGIVCSASTNQKRITGHANFRNGGVVSVIGDVYQFNFGSTEQTDPSSLVETGTAICNACYSFAPVVIGPNQSWRVMQWDTGQTTAPAFEVELGFVEK